MGPNNHYLGVRPELLTMGAQMRLHAVLRASKMHGRLWYKRKEAPSPVHYGDGTF